MQRKASKSRAHTPYITRKSITVRIPTVLVIAKTAHLIPSSFFSFQVMANGIRSVTEDNDAVLENWHSRINILSWVSVRRIIIIDILRRDKHSTMTILHHLHNPTLSAAGCY